MSFASACEEDLDLKNRCELFIDCLAKGLLALKTPVHSVEFSRYDIFATFTIVRDEKSRIKSYNFKFSNEYTIPPFVGSSSSPVFNTESAYMEKFGPEVMYWHGRSVKPDAGWYAGRTMLLTMKKGYLLLTHEFDKTLFASKPKPHPSVLSTNDAIVDGFSGVNVQ